MLDFISQVATTVCTHLEVFIYFLVFAAIGFTLLILPPLLLYYFIWLCVVWIRKLQGIEYNQDMGSKSKKLVNVVVTQQMVDEMNDALKAHSKGIDNLANDMTYAVNDISYKLHSLAASAGLKWNEDKKQWELASGIVVPDKEIITQDNNISKE